MILQRVTFDEIVAAGAPYHPQSRALAPSIAIPHTAIADSPDDLVILDDAVLTPPVGIAWRGFWLGDAVQYLGPGLDWQRAAWLPGHYDPASGTIDIDPAWLQPTETLGAPLFFVDSTIGSSNFAHFVFDTLPYGLLYRRARRALPAIRPILQPLKFPHQAALFDPVFGIPYSQSLQHRTDRPVLVKHLAVPRRQTDLEHTPWRFSFAGIRHIRDAVIERWAGIAHGGVQPGYGRPPRLNWRRRGSAASRAREAAVASRGAPLKVHLHRIQDVEALRRTGNLRGRNFANLEALGPLLLGKGYVVYEPALVPLDQVVCDLSRAETIVALHGAGLANCIFAPPGARIFEITGHDSTWRCLEALSAVLGHEFTELRQPRPADPDCPLLDLVALAARL